MHQPNRSWQTNMTLLQDRWVKTYWDLRIWTTIAFSFGNTGEALAKKLLLQTGFDAGVAENSKIISSLDPPLTIPDAFIEEGYRLQQEVNVTVSRYPKFENVYQAAVYAMTNWGWNGNHQHDAKLFRGESNIEWSEKQFTASIYRNTPDDIELAARVRKLDVAAHWFRKRYPKRQDTDLEVIAILQHYALPTWLIDLSTSIYVALYFASGEPTGTGVVYVYSKKEIDALWELAPELVPSVRQIKPQFVPRINRQYGVFLNGGHGWSIRHLVFGQISFGQVSGMRFEDPGLGITEHRLLGNDRDWKWFDDRLWSNFASVESPCIPVQGLLDVSEYENERKREFEHAPVLQMDSVRLPVWPPPLEDLNAYAFRVLGKASNIEEGRRVKASSIIARYHRILCADPSCSFSVRSLHGYIQAIEELRARLNESVQYDLRSLWLAYAGRARSEEERFFLVRKLGELMSELNFEII